MVNLVTRRDHINIDGLDLQGVINLLQEKLEDLGNSASLEISADEEFYVGIVYKSPETEKEAEARIKAEKRHEILRREWYESLKREFEGK